MAEILPKGRLQEPQSADKLEALVYNTNNEVIRVAINVINDVVRQGTLNAAKLEVPDHTALLAIDKDDTTKWNDGDRVTVVKDDPAPGSGLDYVTYAIAEQIDATDPSKTNRVWVVDSVGVPVASSTNDGLMTQTQWTKLENLPEGTDITQSIAALVQADETLEGKVITNEDDIAAVSDVANTLVNSKLNAEAVAGNGFNSTNNGVRIIENRDAINLIDGAGLSASITQNATDIASNDADILVLQGAVSDNKTEADATEAKVVALEPRVKANEDQLAINTPVINTNKTDIATNEGNISTNKNDIGTNATNISGNTGSISVSNGRITDNETDIVTVKAVNATQDGRIEAVETALALEDKVWTGSIALAADTNISTISDQNGDAFQFTAGKKLEVVIEKSSLSLEQGHNLTVGATNATPYVISTRTVQATLGTNGHIIITGNDLSDLNVIEVREEKGTGTVATGFTKSEALAQFTQQNTTAALDLRVASNTTNIGINKTKSEDNEAKIKTNAEDVIKNEQASTTNAADISTNESKATTEYAKIATNTSGIAANKTKADAADTLSKANKVEVDAVKVVADKAAADVNKLESDVAAITPAYKTADTATLASAKADATAKDTALETKIKAEQKVITDGKANTNDVFLKTDYEEKEITITPAVYEGKTYLLKSNGTLTVTIPTKEIITGESGGSWYTSEQYMTSDLHQSANTWWLGSGPRKTTVVKNGRTYTMTPTNMNAGLEHSFTINTMAEKTPAVKATVLVKK